MFDWNRKKERKVRVQSQTSGSIKGENCKASYMDKYMAKSSRSYKHKDYPAWCKKMANRLARYGG